MRDGSLRISAEGEETLRRLYSLLESADGEGYEVPVLLNVLVLERRAPRVEVHSNNDMMKVPTAWLHPLGESLAVGIDRKLLKVSVPGLRPDDELFCFHEGRKRADVVVLMRLHFEAEGDHDRQPLVNYAPGRNPFEA